MVDWLDRHQPRPERSVLDAGYWRDDELLYWLDYRHFGHFEHGQHGHRPGYIHRQYCPRWDYQPRGIELHRCVGNHDAGVHRQRRGWRNDPTAAALTITPSSGAVIAATGPVTLGGANNITLGSTTYASTLITGATALNKTGAGAVTLTAAINVADITNAATPINIQGGSLTVTETGTAGPSSGILGTGTITMTPGTSLTTNSGGGVSILTLANPIVIAAGSGAAIFNGNIGGVTDNQSITFAPGSTAATIFKVGNTNTAGSPTPSAER